MISEFEELAQKIDQLVALVKVCRDENTGLRRQMIEMAATNSILTARIQQAHERVSVVLEKLPAPEQEEA